MRRLAGVLVALAIFGAAGCAAVPARGPVHGVRVTVLEYRSDLASRQVQLEVRNDSGRTIDVRSATLRGAGWSPAPRWTGDPATRIADGRTVDLPAALTTPVCTGARAPRAFLAIRFADGTRALPVRTVDSEGTLRRQHRADCFAADVARSAVLSFDSLTPRPDGTAELGLDARRTSASAGPTIERVLPTPLLSPPGNAPYWTVDETGGAVTITAVPTRCDAHAIAEDKVGTLLPVQVRLADGSTSTVRVAASATLKQRILEWVIAACGTG